MAYKRGRPTFRQRMARAEVDRRWAAHRARIKLHDDSEDALIFFLARWDGREHPNVEDILDGWAAMDAERKRVFSLPW